MQRYNGKLTPLEYLESFLSKEISNTPHFIKKVCHPRFWKDPRFVVDTELFSDGIPMDFERSILRSTSTWHYHNDRQHKRSSHIYTIYGLKFPHEGCVTITHCLDRSVEIDSGGMRLFKIALVRPV